MPTDKELCPECGTLGGVLRNIRDEQDKLRTIRECEVCLASWEPTAQEADWQAAGPGEVVDDLEDSEGEMTLTIGDDLNEIIRINDEPEQPDTKPEIELEGEQIPAAEGLVSWFQECQEQIEHFMQEEGYKTWAEIPLHRRPKLDRPVLRVFGYAGTGKTTMQQKALARLGIPSEDIASMAFTGKACLVMRKKGIPARTMHSSMYKLMPAPENRIQELERKIKEAKTLLEVKELRAELKDAQQLRFKFDQDSELREKALFNLDEVSMVGPELGEDVSRFRSPILVLGDPGQLPPISGEGYFTGQKPDYLLTEIRRQAEGNPIIDFATRARKGIPLPMGVHQTEQGLAIRTSRHIVSDEMLMQADQIITGKNNTRRELNNRCRAALGRHEHLPSVGDKMICLKNDGERGLFNGLFGEVVEVGELFDFSINLKLKMETDDEEGLDPRWFSCLREHFDLYVDKNAEDRTPWFERKRHNHFDFGYAITVHKSQGSQWDNVMLWDDGMFNWGAKHADNRRRWVYTAVTRAAEGVVVAS